MVAHARMPDCSAMSTRSGSRRHRGRHLALAGVVALALVVSAVGCSTGSESASGGATTDGATATTGADAPAALPTCDPARPATAPSGITTLTSGGTTRQYQLTLPAGYDGTTGVPVILDFHDSGFNMVEHSAYTLLAAKAAAVGYLVVTPQAAAGQSGWQLAAGGAVDDFAFVGDLLGQLQTSLCIDPARIYAEGMGVGGLFAGLAACQLPQRIAAVGMVAGSLGSSCEQGRLVSVMSFHGTTDPIVAYDGTVVDSGAGTVGVPQALGSWAAQDGCGTSATQLAVPQSPKTTQLVWDGCPPGITVTLYTIDGGGHTWPGGTQLSPAVAAALGTVSIDLHATDLLLAFFTAHPLVGG